MTFKSEIIFVRILFPFIGGIIYAYLWQSASIIYPLLMLTLLLITYLSIINLSYKNSKAYHFKGINGIMFFLFCFVFGALLCLLNTQRLNKDYFANKSYPHLKVWVNDEPQLSNDILRFQVNVTTVYQNHNMIKTSGKLLIALKLDRLNPIQLQYGDELIITTKHIPIESSNNPGEFDFSAWLASKNIYQQTFINQNQLIKLHTTKGNSIIKYALQERKKQVEIYRKLIKNDEAFAVASTLVLGYRADLSKETLAAYSKTGTIHALSVSGAHVGIIFYLLTNLLSFLDRKKLLKFLKFALICGLIWYYALLTGFSPSVLRSAIMLTIFILAKALNRTSNNYNILAFTAFILLIYNPFYILDVGFQLSFIAVFGLIYLQPKIYKWIYVKNKWLDKLWAATALSLAAQFATFPLSVYYFHQFPVYFIFGNLFILFPLIAMMYLGIAILVLKLYFIAPIFEWIIHATNNGLKWISTLPFSGITSIWLSPWQLFILSLALSLLVFSLANYKKKLLISAICLLIAFQSYASYLKLAAERQSKIIYFSLRKNYAAAFIDSKKAILLTDLNPQDKNYLFFVAPGLDQLQIDDVLFVKWEQDTTVNFFQKKENQITFHDYKILLVDQKFDHKKINQSPIFNAIWLHENPKKSIFSLKDEVNFSSLLIDATNKDYKIKEYEKIANKFKLQHYTLKKNKAYLINLK